MTASRFLAVEIDRPAAEVYAVAADPRRLPAWAAGLATATPEPDQGGWWRLNSPLGRVRVRFVPANPYGVLDHEVELPDGRVVLNPMRVVSLDDGRCEVYFLQRRPPGSTDEADAADVAAIRADLDRLAALVEAEAGEAGAAAVHPPA